MLTLKRYQSQALDKLAAYLEKVRILRDPKSPYLELREAKGYSSEYHALHGLEDTPFVCLRLPTGGGKTLLSAHTVAIATDCYLESDYPIVLWLTPTDAIRRQTLETLRNPQHPNRQVLDSRFQGRVRVLDITEFTQVRPQDLGAVTCVFVATFGAFRVTSTEGRKVYAHNEFLEPHFSTIPSMGWLDQGTDGRPKFSFANLLAYHRPLVIVDEAHNHKTELSAEVLRRVRAAAVVEYTATPAEDSNVLYKVSASELRAEDMIKLPVRLTEHPSWIDAVTGALQTRTYLERLCGSEEDYIRPLVLIQAQDKNEEVNVEALVRHLVEQENIPRAAIAVATGNQRELDNVNLFERASPIRYVITVDALKEGWDCSFAYVFCSVAKVRSGRDAEQLLGRVLRMPYAKRRRQDDLNKAYAHLPVATWSEGLGRIRDNLVGMGFEDYEAEQSVQLEFPRNPEGLPLGAKQVVVYSAESPNVGALSPVLQGNTRVEVLPSGEYRATFRIENRSDELELRDRAPCVYGSGEAQAMLVKELERNNAIYRPITGSERGESLSVPQLWLDLREGEPRAAEKEDFLSDGVNLLQFPVDMNSFRVVHEEHIYEIDVLGSKIRERLFDVQESQSLSPGVTHWDEIDLVSWFCRRLQQPDVQHSQMVEFTRRHVHHLIEHRGVPLVELVRLRFMLEKLLKERITALRQECYRLGIQEVLFDHPSVARVVPNVSTVFRSTYPVKSCYTGSIQFTKHFFPLIGDMDGEEVDCAKVLDAHPIVRVWIRNLDSQPKHAFWLPTSSGKFYPDFVAELQDGRILVVEYKGAHLLSDPDTLEKKTIGHFWAQRSDGRCVFLMAVKRDASGRDIWEQVQAATT